MEQRINKLYLVIIPLLVVGISYGYTVFSICLGLLVLRLLVTDRHTVGFYFIMYGGVVGGVVRTMYPFFPIYGMVLVILGVILSFDRIKEIFRTGRISIIYLLATFILFTFFYYAGPRDDFSAEKIKGIIQAGTFALLGFYLFCKCENIKNESVIQIIFVSTLLMITFVIQKYGFSRGGLFNYEWFRHQEYSYAAMNHFESGTLVSYQHISMNMLFGLAIYLAQKELDKEKAIYYSVIASQLILMTGCRQAILGLILVVILRFSYFRVNKTQNNNFIQKHFASLFIAFTFLILSYQFLSSLNVDFITSTLESGDEGRVLLLMQGLQLFEDNMLLGVGLGGYHNITGDVYPHNIIVEVLCECGLAGLIIFTMIAVTCMRQTKQSLLFSTNNGSFLYLVLAALFVRVSVSGDFTISIQLFSALFATLAFSGISRKKVC